MSVTEAEHFSPCDEVPDEVLLQVFSYLQPWELLLAVAGVCRRWRLLSRDRSLWLDALLDVGECPDEDALLITLSSAPALRSLAFEDPFAVVSKRALAAVLSLSSQLRSFHFMPVEYDANAVLAVVRKLAPQLEELSLRVHRQLVAICPHLVAELAAMPRLESLRLLGPVPGTATAADSGCWPHLRKLDLRQAVLDGLDLLHQILRCCSDRLETLLLPRYAVLPEAVLAQLRQCRRLRALAPARIEDLTTAAELPQLEDLLVEADLFDPEKHSFLSGLQVRCVRVLSLRIGDEAGAVSLAAACPATQHLTLRGTLSRWAVDIAKRTPDVRSLRVVEPPVRLRLGTADPLPVRVAVLEDVCRVLPRLQFLDLRHCFQRRVPPALLEALQRGSPTARVILPPVTLSYPLS